MFVRVLPLTSCSWATTSTLLTSPIDTPRGSPRLSPRLTNSAPIEAKASPVAASKSGGPVSVSFCGSLYRASSVPTIASLANIPVNNPTVAGQLSRSSPRGVKAGVIALPITLSTESSESSLPKLRSEPIEFRKFSTITTITMVLPARNINPFSLSHVVNRILRSIGAW